MRARGHLRLLMLTLLVVGCGGGHATTTQRTQRERDSVIGASKLPGARGVKNAQAAADSAAARNARLDSIGGSP